MGMGAKEQQNAKILKYRGSKLRKFLLSRKRVYLRQLESKIMRMIFEENGKDNSKKGQLE